MKKFLIAIALVAVAGIIAAALWFIPIFKVNAVVIDQQYQTSEEAITGITDQVKGQNLLRVNTTAVASELIGLPWVTEASVAKKFPNTIEVHLVEYQAVLAAQRSDGDHLVDASGKMFVVAPRPDHAVLITNTNEDNQEVFRAAASIVTSISEPERDRITEIKAITPYSFELHVGEGDDAKVIVWGAAENNHDKAVAFSAALKRPESEIDITGAPTISVKE